MQSAILSIIFVNWNSTDYLIDCLASIYEHTRSIEFEIIVVDNASPAADSYRVKEKFEKIKLVTSSRNLGFAGANNLAFKHSSGAYLLFLNPDTKLFNAAIQRMLRHLESLPDAGVVGCKLLNGDLSVQTSCIQTFPTILNQALDAEFLRRLWPNSGLWGIRPLFLDGSRPAKVEVISGACMMMRRNVFETVGFFSEDYFMYGEDLDLCHKAVRAGFFNYFVGQAEIIHYGGGSSTPESATAMKWRSILHYCDKFRGPFYLLFFKCVMLVIAALRLTAIGSLRVIGKSIGNHNGKFSAMAKWRTILKTVLTGSRVCRDPSPLTAIPECQDEWTI